jgi:hypothetical protein
MLGLELPSLILCEMRHAMLMSYRELTSRANAEHSEALRP